jgi:Cu/Ag efflux protein CusF
MQRINSLLNRLAVALLILTAVLAITFTGCSKPMPAKEYQMHGQITGLDAEGHVATIKHEQIPGFMGAMTMGYPVKDTAEFSKLKVGDTINATVYVKDDDMWVGNIQKAAK